MSAPRFLLLSSLPVFSLAFYRFILFLICSRGFWGFLYLRSFVILSSLFLGFTVFGFGLRGNDNGIRFGFGVLLAFIFGNLLSTCNLAAHWFFGIYIFSLFILRSRIYCNDVMQTTPNQFYGFLSIPVVWFFNTLATLCLDDFCLLIRQPPTPTTRRKGCI